MATHTSMDIGLLRQLLAYDQETGLLTWLSRPVEMFVSRQQTAAHNAASWNTKFVGRLALQTRHNCGYLYGKIFDCPFLAHRVIWAMVHGEWPAADIDHINGIRDDNRICNLRSVNRSVNQQNKARTTRNTSGVTGVLWDESRQKWRARIRAEGRDIIIGRFSDFDDAVAAREAANVLYGFHPNHGKR